MNHTPKTTFLQMYQIDLCEEVLASAPNNTSLHGINMWKITLCFVELVRLCWGGGAKTGFLLLFFINYLLWLKNGKLYPENNASPFIACLSLHSVNRQTIATLSSPEVFLVLLTLISSTCDLVWALPTSFTVPKKAKSLPPWRVILIWV